MRLVAHFPQQMLRNALYQYTICTVPQNKFPANAKFAEFRNNQNLRMETLIGSLANLVSCRKSLHKKLLFLTYPRDKTKVCAKNKRFYTFT